MPFNPAAYSNTPIQAHEKLEKRRKWEKENAHLALPFFVKGLVGKDGKDIVPPQYPGETSIVLAKSHEGKSTILKAWAALCEQEITRKARRAVSVYVSHEDTTEISAKQQIKRYGSESSFMSSQMLFVGRSFGMSPDDIADMHMSNVARILQYANQEQFGDPMPFSAIFYDYIQRTPPDPERRAMRNIDQKRLQMADDTARLCNAAVTFTCPVVAGSQSGLKNLISPYSAEMPIPGPSDTDEAKEIFQIPDRIYGVWKVTQKYSPGRMVESGNWRFEARKDLFFIWFEKFRYYQPDSMEDDYAPINQVYPILIDKNANFYYDKKYHDSIYIGA